MMPYAIALLLSELLARFGVAGPVGGMRLLA
jgi:hypothetical protein